ncbi:hypothetical protein ACJRO7_013199 [Eucalyptus globulus]|uniref:Uncharacterized protein n=1 Tax=Eucalyptus globulus TaxID=34317 RepID=A0ABD3LQB3_EUCGL
MFIQGLAVDRVEEEAVVLLRMEASITKSRSDLSRKTQWMKPPPPPTPPHHLDAKTLSSRRLSTSSITLSRYLNPSDLGNDFGDDDDDGVQQLYSRGGTTASVPFTWESQPGTPKVRFCDDVVPPLTPPPSYFYVPARDTINRKQQLRKTKFLTTLLPKLRSSASSSPASSSYSSSSSSSSSYSSYSLWSSVPPSPAVGGRARTSASRLSLPTRVGKWEEKELEDHVPALCFGFGRRATNARPRGCYLAMIRVLRGNFP